MCPLYSRFCGPNQWWKESSNHQSHLKPAKEVANAHVLIFLSLVQTQERLKHWNVKRNSSSLFFVFSKRLFGLFLWDQLVLVCTSCNSAESIFCLSYIIICLFVIDNPLENWVICTLLSKVVLEREVRVWDERKMQAKVPVAMHVKLQFRLWQESSDVAQEQRIQQHLVTLWSLDWWLFLARYFAF